MRSPYIEHAASGLPNITLLGAATVYPGSRPASVTTRSQRMVTDCLLTRSMLIKMYLPVCAYIFTGNQIHANVHWVYLVIQIA